MLQPSIAVLRRPIARGGGAGPDRPGIKRRQLNAPALLIGLASVEHRSLKLEAVDNHSAGQHSETSVGGILEVVSQRRRRIFRRRFAVKVRHWAQSRLRRRSTIE